MKKLTEYLFQQVSISTNQTKHWALTDWEQKNSRPVDKWQDMFHFIIVISSGNQINYLIGTGADGHA